MVENGGPAIAPFGGGLDELLSVRIWSGFWWNWLGFTLDRRLSASVKSRKRTATSLPSADLFMRRWNLRCMLFMVVRTGGAGDQQSSNDIYKGQDRREKNERR